MALFSSTMTRPEFRVRENGWQEISYRVFPSWVGAFFRALGPVRKVFIRKNEFGQWYEDRGDSTIHPVSIERMLDLDDRWDLHERQQELYEGEAFEDEEARPIA